MRAWVAAALVACFALPVLLPYVSPDAESSLPPCCRRNGAHRCAMAMRMAAEQTPDGRTLAFRTPAVRCPFQKALASAYRSTLYPAFSVASVSAVSSYRFTQTYASFPRSSTGTRSHYKRGPPFLVS